MARSGIDLGDSQFQVGARLKKFALLLSLCLICSATSAGAATKKPSPTPTVKSTVKATAKPKVKVSPKATVKATTKPMAKPTAKASPKATAKPTSKATAKPTAKPTVKPKPKPKPKPRKKVRVYPSPKPKWPPVGYTYESGIYAKVPSSKELVGVISAKGNLASQVQACGEFICGAVQVASEPGCVWWEVNSKVRSKEGVILGALRTISGGTSAKQVRTILLVSPEPIATMEYVSDIEVICHQGPRPSEEQSMTYTKVGE
jgi:hypothetical protein